MDDKKSLSTPQLFLFCFFYLFVYLCIYFTKVHQVERFNFCLILFSFFCVDVMKTSAPLVIVVVVDDVALVAAAVAEDC